MASRLQRMSHNTWRISLTTFNCAKAFPFDQHELVSRIVQQLLPQSVDHDVYVLGFQEFVSIWQGSFPSIMLPLLKSLAGQICEYLNSLSGKKYKLVGSSSSGAIGLLVLADESLTQTQVSICKYRCGYFWSSLKGAVAMCCTLERTGATPETFTFICCHLASNKGESYNAQRIEDYHATMATCTEQFRLSAFKQGHIFFMGDLNFRLEGLHDLHTDYTSPEVFPEMLQNRDELNVCKRKGIIFQEFEEAGIRFPPTYKYLIGKADLLDPKRMPAWCDRILFKNYSGYNYTIDSYGSMDRTAELQFSDHKPVRLIIQVPQLPVTAAVTSLRGLPLTRGHLAGDITDIVLGYGGWAVAKKVHYWIIPILVLFLILKGL